MLLRVLIARLSDRGQLLELRKPRVEHAEALKLPRSAKLRRQQLRHGGSVIGAVPVDVGVRNEIACRRLIRYTMCQGLLALMNTSCSTTCYNANNNEWQSVINRRAAKSAIGGSDEEAACGGGTGNISATRREHDRGGAFCANLLGIQHARHRHA